MVERNETREGAGATKLLLGRLLAGIGLILCVPVGAYFTSIAIESVGIVLGIASYAFGARRLGKITIVLSVVAMFVGLLIGQGVLPGSYDEAVNGVEDSRQWPPFDDESRDR